MIKTAEMNAIFDVILLKAVQLNLTVLFVYKYFSDCEPKRLNKVFFKNVPTLKYVGSFLKTSQH